MLGNVNNFLSKVSLPGVLWQVLPDPQADLLLVEVRSTTEKNATFFTVSLSVPRANPLPLTLPDPWWVSLYGSWQGHLVIQGYQDPSVPVPQGIYVYRLSDGLLRWSDPLRRCAGRSPQGILTRHPQWPQHLEELSLIDGSPQRLAADVWEATRQQGDISFFATLALPEAFAPSDPIIAALTQTLTSTLAPLALPTAYLDLPSHSVEVVAWYTSIEGESNEATTYAQYLGIWQHHQLVHTHCLQVSTAQLSPDPFMVHRQYLIWHDDQSQLFVANLDQL
jgi:hypothetical protein